MTVTGSTLLLLRRPDDSENAEPTRVVAIGLGRGRIGVADAAGVDAGGLLPVVLPKLDRRNCGWLTGEGDAATPAASSPPGTTPTLADALLFLRCPCPLWSCLSTGVAASLP